MSDFPYASPLSESVPPRESHVLPPVARFVSTVGFWTATIHSCLALTAFLLAFDCIDQELRDARPLGLKVAIYFWEDPCISLALTLLADLSAVYGFYCARTGRAYRGALAAYVGLRLLSVFCALACAAYLASIGSVTIPISDGVPGHAVIYTCTMNDIWMVAARESVFSVLLIVVLIFAILVRPGGRAGERLADEG